ncbi:MAG: PHP domain-containing protein [Chloroflexota bacterium]|nr:PHP domain-containing protein [Chloroflexota bacterium]
MDMHCHSHFSDGLNSPEEMVCAAIEAGLEAICMVEHVRADSDWLGDFCREMASLKARYRSQIAVYSGIEAKVCDLHGSIDIAPGFIGQTDLVVGAFHRLPSGDGFLSQSEIAEHPGRALSLWAQAMRALLEVPHVDVVAHPTAILKENGIAPPTDLKREIARRGGQTGIAFELNARYGVPDPEFVEILSAEGVRLVFGSDSHSAAEVGRLYRRGQRLFGRYMREAVLPFRAKGGCIT